MIEAGSLKRNQRLEVDGDPFTVVDVNHSNPTARGGNTLVRAKLRNIRSGQLLDKTFKSGDRLKEPDFEIRPAQYLYEEGGDLHYFMDQSSYEQFALPKEQIEYELQFIRFEDEVRALVFNGTCIGIELPQTVVLEVQETDPGVKGDTVTNTLKPAVMETGLSVQVPLFIEAGEKLVVDTRDARYIRRA